MTLNHQVEGSSPSAVTTSLRTRLAIGIVAALSATLACTTPSVSPPASDTHAALREIPFEITSNKPWVEVRINGSEPQWFILDTGCRGTSVIARECAERIHLALGSESPANLGAGEGVRVALTSTTNVTLSLGGEAFTAPALGVFPLEHVEPYEGRKLDGLLGEDFMRKHVVEIDYARRRIRLFDPQSYTRAGKSSPIPITFHDGLVVARASMTPPGRAAIDCQVVIDTGVRTTVVWYRPFVLAHDLVASQPHVITGTIGGGAGGETRGDIGRLDRLTIGELEIPRPTVVFSRDETGVFAGHDEAGIVGGEILRRCKVTFDYAHERLYLEPYPGEFAAFESDMSGMFLVSPGPDFRRVTIQSVAEGTPASEAGLARGDEIVAIDGRSIAGRTLDECRELFKQGGAKVLLAVKRGGEQRDVELKLRRLV